MLDGIKAVLFDLDGTLVDSMWMWGAIDVEYLGRHGLTVYPGLQQAIEGMSFSETAAYFKEQFALPDSLDVIKTEWIAMSKEKYAHEVPLKPGAREFLEYLKSHGIKAGIATSNGRELLDAVVAGQGLAPYFQCLMTSCEAGAGKPAPDIYLKVAAELGAKPEDCLVFEDTPAGAQAGKAAGAKVCSIYDAYAKDRQAENRRLADYYIHDFYQVLDGTYETLVPGQE